MHLIFTCPETNRQFRSEHYTLLPGHAVTDTPDGKRQLKGMVMLTTECPECTGMHRFQVEDILCPLHGGDR